MNTHVEGPVLNAQEYKDEKGSDTSPTPPMTVEDIERSASAIEIDAATEARVLRKLDIRIVPMICWIYLMNFMDRGAYNIASGRTSLIMNSQHWKRQALWYGGRPWY